MDMRSPLPAPSPWAVPDGRSSYVRLAGSGVGCVHKDWVDAFANSGLSSTEDLFRTTGQALTKPGLGNRYRARLEIKTDRGAAVVFLKRFNGEPLRDQVRRLWEDGVWHTAAEREASVALNLQGAGLAAPILLAWARLGGRWQRKSVVVLSAVPGQPAPAWLENSGFGPESASASASGSLPFASRRRFTAELATLVRRFHAAGWRHRDLYLCHVFVDEAAGGLQLSLIDLQRVFRPRWRRERWRIKDLAQLHYSSLAHPFSRTDRLRFLLDYLGCRRLTATHKSLIRRVQRKTAAMVQRHRESGF